MKAYYLSIKDDDEGVVDVVFANNAKEAKKQVYSSWITDYWSGEWIYLRVNRARRYDDMDNLSAAELALQQWKDGWRWLDMDYPDPDESTDEDFYEWYKNTFGQGGQESE